MNRFMNVKLGFLDNTKTQELFSKRKIWAELFQEKFKIPKISIKQIYFDLIKRRKSEQFTALYDLLKRATAEKKKCWTNKDELFHIYYPANFNVGSMLFQHCGSPLK